MAHLQYNNLLRIILSSISMLSAAIFPRAFPRIALTSLRLPPFSLSLSVSLCPSVSPLLRARSRTDRGQTRSRAQIQRLDPFRRPLRPCRGRHAISRSRGSITKVGTHFHVAATRRTGSLFFSFCLLPPPLPPTSLSLSLSLSFSRIPCSPPVFSPFASPLIST